MVKITTEGGARIKIALKKIDANSLKALAIGIEKSAYYLERKAKQKVTQVLNRRSGDLAASITTEIKRTRDNVIARVGPGGSAAKYAAIQEFGGTIVPKNVRFLTIPFPGIKGRARDYEDTFIAKGVIFQKTGARGYRPLFALKEKVTIPPRPYLIPTLHENIAKVEGFISAEIRKLIKTS